MWFYFAKQKIKVTKANLKVETLGLVYIKCHDKIKCKLTLLMTLGYNFYSRLLIYA